MNTRFRYLLLVTIQLSVGIQVHSQVKPRLNFSHLGIEHGLSNNTVNCLLQDKMGFIWIGTDNGLNRYDGYEFLRVGGGDDKNTLTTQKVKSLIEDNDGFIWIGTIGGGLHRYDPLSGNILHYYNDDEKKTKVLSDNNIRQICMDRKGNLWLATRNGLTSYNRRSGKFKIFRNIPGDDQSLSFNDVRALCPSATSDKVWVGTFAGLCLLDPVTAKFKRYPYTKINKKFSTDSMLASAVSTLYEDNSDRLWIGMYDVGFMQFLNEKTGKFTQYWESDNPYSYKNVINKFAEDGAGRIWMGCRGGLTLFDTTIKIFYNYAHDIRDPRSLSINIIYCILKDKNGTMWLGTNGGGINCFSPLPKNFTVFKHSDNDPHSLSSNLIRNIFKDKSGRLWISYRQAGLDTGNLETGNFGKFNPYTEPSTVNQIKYSPQTHTDKALYHVRNGRRYKLNANNGSFKVQRTDKNFPFIKQNEWIESCITDRAGNTWIGTYGVLCRVNPKDSFITAFIFTPGVPSIRSQISFNGLPVIFEDRNGKIWIGTDLGLDMFDPVNQMFTNYKIDRNDTAYTTNSLSNNYILKIIEDSYGNIWVGTQKAGVYKLDKMSKLFKRYRVPGINNDGSLSHILSLGVTGDGIVWAGTENGGLIKIDQASGVVKLVTTRDGLPDNCIAGILEDSRGHLWISTLNGLCEFVPNNSQKRDYSPGYVKRIFTKADGLPSDEFQKGSCFKDGSGRMYFGNTAGLVSFIPEKLKKIPVIAPLLITGIQLFNRSISPGDSTGILKESITTTKKLKLNYQQNMVKLNFASLGFIDAGNTIYRYRLVGFNDRWFTTKRGEHEVTYTSLPPGSFVFEVKGSNANYPARDEDRATSLSIEITPPFWKTIQFRIFLFAALCLLTYFFYRWRLQSALRNSREKSEIDRKISELSLTALRSRMNPHFIFNTLSSVQSMVRNDETAEAEKYINSLSGLIRKMLENSDKKTISLEEELEMLTAYTELEKMRFKGRFQFEFTLIGIGDTENIQIPAMLLQPFIENAIIHAFTGFQGTGLIQLKITRNDDLLTCEISDNGIGRNRAGEFGGSSKQHRSIAIEDIRKRLEELNKMLNLTIKLQITDLKDENGEPKGTRVILDIPVIERF